MPLPTESLQYRMDDGITNYNKDSHTGTPINFYGNSKAGKMTCNLERNYRGRHRKKLYLHCTLKEEQEIGENEKKVVLRTEQQRQRDGSRKVGGDLGSDGQGCRVKNCEKGKRGPV